MFTVLLFGITSFERQHPESSIQNIWDALWYSIVTLTTVGYGDSYPLTTGGRILSLVFILSSLGLLGYLIGSATNLIQTYMENKNNGYYGTRFTDHFVIIGWNNFAKNVASQILLAGNKIAIVTSQKDDVEIIATQFSKDKVFTLFTDLNNYEEYSKVNLEEARSVFVNLEDDSLALVFIINMQKYYSNVDYIISLQNIELRETFNAVGINHVIGKNEIASRLVASYVFEPDVADYTEDLISTSAQEDESDIQQYKVIEGNPFLGRKYIDAFYELKNTYNSVLIGLAKENHGGARKLLKNPQGEELIELDDYVILISSGQTKKLLEKDFMVSEGFYV